MAKAKALHAYPALEALGYEFNWQRGCGGDERYWHLRSADGPEKVKVHARSHQPGQRYWIGIAYRLFPVVDKFALWFAGEEYLYIIPSPVLEQLWIAAGRPVSQADQFDFNLDTDYHCIENPQLCLLPYRVPIPNGM